MGKNIFLLIKLSKQPTKIKKNTIHLRQFNPFFSQLNFAQAEIKLNEKKNFFAMSPLAGNFPWENTWS